MRAKFRWLIVSILLSVVFSGFCADKVKLVYMNWTINEIPFEKQFIEEFEAAYPNIEIEVITKPVDVFDRQLILAFHAGTLPDVFEARPGYTTSLGSMGIMADLTSYLEADPEYAAQFTSAGLELGQLEGRQIAIPWRGGAWAVYVNQRLLDAKDIEIPENWTWEQFVEIAQALTDSTAGVYGFAMAGDPTDYGTAQSWAAHLAMNGGRFFENGEVAIASAAGIRALQQYYDLVFKYRVVPPDVASLTYQDIVSLFGQDRIGMWVNGPWFVATVLKAYPDVELRIAPLPTVEGAIPGSVTSGTTLAIGSTTKHPDEAWQFIRFLTKRENLLRWGEAGGFVPPLRDTSGAKYLEEAPLSVFVEMEQLPNTFQVGNLPHAYEILRVLGNAIQSVLLGQLDPQSALEEAERQWEEIIGGE